LLTKNDHTGRGVPGSHPHAGIVSGEHGTGETGAIPEGSVVAQADGEQEGDGFGNAVALIGDYRVRYFPEGPHHADVTAIEGESYRVRESEQETAARRRKK
jgi:hypothetical protein